MGRVHADHKSCSKPQAIGGITPEALQLRVAVSQIRRWLADAGPERVIGHWPDLSSHSTILELVMSCVVRAHPSQGYTHAGNLPHASADVWLTLPRA